VVVHRVAEGDDRGPQRRRAEPLERRHNPRMVLTPCGRFRNWFG
jgi:hypothetical protein